MIGIYQIRNIRNNKIYIGSAKNLKKRWWTHRHLLRNNKHHSVILQRAWNNYKEDSFVFEILEYIENIKDLISTEQSWFDKLNPQYNSCPKAGSSLGWKHSEKTKQKLKEINSGDNNPMRIKSQSNPKPIKTTSNRIYPGHTTQKRPIIRISETGEIKEFNSITEASKELNLKCPTSIQRALVGISKSSRGFIWKYKEI